MSETPQPRDPHTSLADDEEHRGATEPRHTNPITPWVQTVQFAPIWLFLGFMFFRNVSSSGNGPVLLIAVAATILVLFLVAGLQFMAWQRLTFWFDGDGDFRMDSGIFTRRERRLQLSRLQGVDVAQPLLARVVGLASVNIEVAGAGDSRVTVSYLTLPEAEALRNEVLARSAGVRPDAGEAPERPLVQVPPKDLFVSLLLRGSTVLLVGVTVLIVVVTVMAEGTAGLLVLVTGVLPILIVVSEFTQYFNFHVAESADGLRIKSGLFQIKAQTFPPGRVQAVEFVQPFLWRRKNWVRVRLNVAGLQSADDSQSTEGSETVLLPVAPRDVALSVVSHVLPNVDLTTIELEPAPARTSKRAWIQHAQLGVGFSDKVFVTKRGRFERRLAVVPHARTQSVRVTQGPWERSLGLATMHVDSPPGPVEISALHRDAGEARQLAEEQNKRSQEAATADPTTHWMSPAVPADDGVILDPRSDSGRADPEQSEVESEGTETDGLPPEATG
jgi:putative membrane protein